MGRDNYRPSRFMLPTSHFDREKGERAVRFIEMLRHTKGKWAGKPFHLLDWQYDIVMDLFGIVKEDGNRQFRTAYVEIGKKNCTCSTPTGRLPRRYTGRLRTGSRRPS